MVPWSQPPRGRSLPGVLGALKGAAHTIPASPHYPCESSPLLSVDSRILQLQPPLPAAPLTSCRSHPHSLEKQVTAATPPVHPSAPGLPAALQLLLLSRQVSCHTFRHWGWKETRGPLSSYLM